MNCLFSALCGIKFNFEGMLGSTQETCSHKGFGLYYVFFYCWRGPPALR